MNNDTPQYAQGVLLEDVPFENYRAVDAINASGLKHVLRSPAHFQHWLKNPQPETPALRMGKLIHLCVLEPARFQQHVCVRPSFNLRTNDGRADLASWRTDIGREAIEVTSDEKQQLDAMVASVHAHAPLRRLLQHGKREVSLFWTDPVRQIPCKARMDFVADKTHIIVDLKSCMDSRPDTFARDVYKLDYALSCAHYTDGANVTNTANSDRFVFVALEKSAPYGLHLYEMSADFLAFGHVLWSQAMDTYAACRTNNIWPGYTDSFLTLEPPPWVRLP